MKKIITQIPEKGYCLGSQYPGNLKNLDICVMSWLSNNVKALLVALFGVSSFLGIFAVCCPIGHQDEALTAAGLRNICLSAYFQGLTGVAG